MSINDIKYSHYLLIIIFTFIVTSTTLINRNFICNTIHFQNISTPTIILNLNSFIQPLFDQITLI